MDSYKLIWSISIGLLIGFFFFVLGILFAKKTNFRIGELWYVHNIRKARKLYQKGCLEESLDEYNQLLTNLDEDIWFKESDFLNLAIIQKEKRNVHECIVYLNKIIDLKIEIPVELKIDFTVLLLNNGYYSDAKKFILYGEDGNDSIWHSILAWIFAKNGDFEKAIKEAEIALTMSSDDDFHILNRCGIAFEEAGCLKRAHQYYKKCLASEDAEILMWALNNIGSICNSRKNECSRKKDFKNSKRYNRVSYKYYLKAFNILHKEKLWQKSIDPSLVLTNLISKTSNIEEKTDYIEKALEIAPYSVFLHHQIAWMYYDLEDYKNALKNSQKCYDLNPKDISAIEVLSASYLRNHKIEKSIEKAFEAWKIKQDIMSGYLEGYVAEAYEKSDKLSEALKYYKIAIAKGFNQEKNYVYFYKKAISLANRICDFKSSFSLCAEALIFLPDNEEIKKLLGKSLKESGTSEIYNFNPLQNI